MPRPVRIALPLLCISAVFAGISLSQPWLAEPNATNSSGFYFSELNSGMVAALLGGTIAAYAAAGVAIAARGDVRRIAAGAGIGIALALLAIIPFSGHAATEVPSVALPLGFGSTWAIASVIAVGAALAVLAAEDLPDKRNQDPQRREITPMPNLD